MTTYTIDTRSNDKGILSVEAGSHHEAAKAAALKMWPKQKPVITVERVTGDGTGSGMFQAYTPAGSHQRSSHGNMFHVSED